MPALPETFAGNIELLIVIAMVSIPAGVPGRDAFHVCHYNHVCLSPTATCRLYGDAEHGLKRGYYAIRPPQLRAKTAPAPLNRETYGRILPRHTETASVLFADYHVKAMKIDALRDPNLRRARKINP
ncbi:MAG: hypothetical protein SFU56_04740 [Capsulimonadales bacterium]|nr:hypothetical protein [Capsulimonadales bacterium]